MTNVDIYMNGFLLCIKLYLHLKIHHGNMCLDLRLMGWSNQERDIIMNFFFKDLLFQVVLMNLKIKK